MSAVIEVRGVEGVHRMLADYMTPKLPKRMQDATKAGAEVFKKPVKAEAAKVSKRLNRSVSVRKAARDRPATILTFRPKIAWFRHFIIGGTRDHGPRRASALFFVPGWNPYSGASSKGVGNNWVRVPRVRGVKPNPIIARVFTQYEATALAAIDRSLDQSETA